MAEARNLGLFPFCVQLGPPIANLGEGPVALPVGQGTLYPILMPIKDAVKMWWRVKDWQLSFDYSYYEDLENEYDGSYAEVEQTTLSTRISQINNISAPFVRALTEQFLVCEKDAAYAGITMSDWQPQVTQNFVITDDPSTFIDESNSGSFSRTATTMNWSNGPLQIGTEFPLFVYSDDTFKFVWYGTLMSVGNTSSWSIDSYTEPVSSIQLILQQSTYSIPLYGIPTEDGPPVPWLGEVSNITIQPIEWWPYDPLDGGGPIYDSVTGAVLRPDYIGLS